MACRPIDDGGSASDEHEYHNECILHDRGPQPPGDGPEVEVGIVLACGR